MSMTLAPMARENIASRIGRTIRQELMTGRLRPGDPITLRSLAESLGVSQTPVREALLQLVSERVLTLTPGKSITVPLLDAARLIELRDIRVSLESLATLRAAARVDAALRKRLAAIHTQLMVARRRGDREGLLRGNLDFHFTLYGAADMPHLLGMIETLWVQTAPYLAFLYRPPFPRPEGEHPHAAILRALATGDGAAAAAEIRRDIESHGELLMRALHEQGIIA